MNLLIKVIRTLYKYFLPESKKMCLSSKVKDLRDKLLQNCKYAIYRLEEGKDMIEKGSGIRLDNTKETSTQVATSYSNPTSEITMADATITSGGKNHKFKDKIINDVYSVIHGVMTQEWELFLYDILAEGVIYYLSIGDPKYQLRLEKLKPTFGVADIRTYIAEEIKDSFRGYEELFKRTRTLFEVEELGLFKEMQKQIQIRHVFQHSRGIIRRRDLSDIGSNGPDACIYILDEEGQPQPYKENKDIWLSLPEIQKLYETVEQYSEKFQIQAEKAKPMK